jgi:hypothetical protein
LRGGLLIDGFLTGTWSITCDDRGPALGIELFAPAPDANEAIRAERGRCLLAFATDATDGRVEIVRSPL